MPDLHPLSVHVPIALLLIVPVLDILGLMRGQESYHKASMAALAVAVLVAAGCVASGLAAVYGISLVGPPLDLMFTHLGLGAGLFVLATAVMVVRWKMRERAPGGVHLLAAAELVVFWALVVATGHTGGKMVYTYGVGTELSAPNMGDYANIEIAEVDLTGIGDGVYSGDVVFDGFEYRVEVTLADDAIARVAVTDNRSTSYAQVAERGVIPKIVAQQKPGVDAVSGATATSKALMKAVERALVAARRDRVANRQTD